MALGFEAPHQAYADSVMISEASKLLKIKPVPSTKAAEKESFKYSVEQDRAARRKEAGYTSRWSTATAKKINSQIKVSARKSIKAAGKRMVKNGELIAATGSVLNAPVGGIALASAAILAVGTSSGDRTATLSRRAFIMTGVSAMGAMAIVPGQALADNVSYISAVESAVQSYTQAQAPAIIRDVAAGK